MKALIDTAWLDGMQEQELSKTVIESLDDVDFYEGRNTETVMMRLLESYGNLIDALAEKGALEPEDVNNIVPGVFIDRFSK